ncbi:MAG: hypothetical protein ACOH2E_06010 [Candidatus Paracaedibacter sp.]
MEKNKSLDSLIDIVDEARDLLDTRIDKIRFLNTEKILGESITRIQEELAFLKDMRNLLVLSENFRD